MALRCLLALALLVSALGPGEGRAAERPLHLVLTPSQRATDLLATGDDFGRALAALLGRPVRVTVASDYAAVIEALRDRAADLAFVHPAGYVLAARFYVRARAPGSRASRACAARLVTIAMVTVVDVISARVRARLA